MKLLAFGEILYDVFENKSKIGGAPFNFTAHFSKLGGQGYILSAVGNDELGKNALNVAKKLGVNTKYILKNNLQTGICNVTYSENEPFYDLSSRCAYDGIEITDEKFEEIEKENFDVLYFGTLAQRSEASRKTIENLLKRKCFKKIFLDMNLRQHYYSQQLIEKSLLYADIVKVNRDEYELLKRLKFCGDIKSLCDSFGIEKLLLTLDKDGIMLYDAKAKKTYKSSKPQNTVVSTVGAGDSSSACFLFNYLSGKPLDECVEKANIMGDYVVTFTEAIPEYSQKLSKQLNDTNKKG